MNCPICFKLINFSCIPSCTHHFCYPCILKWCNKKFNPGCPICRVPIRELKFDREFDQLIKIIKNNNINEENFKNIIENTPLLINKNIFCNNRKIYIDFNDSNIKIPIGITLKNNNGPGVLITNIIKNNMAYYSGLIVNDIILYINNIECTNHKHCINILEDFKLSNKIVCCIMMN